MINAEYVKALQDTGLREKLLAQGADILATSPEQYATYIKNEITRWTKVVKDSGAKLD